MKNLLKNIPLIINTPFSVFKTMEAASVDEKSYFAENEIEAIYNPIRQYADTPFKPLNVVIIIMESFSKECIGALNGNRGYTPFLDSLIAKSLVFMSQSAKPVLVIASGINRVNETRVAGIIGESIARATPDFVRLSTGFAIGGIPPVGHAVQPTRWPRQPTGS